MNWKRGIRKEKCTTKPLGELRKLKGRRFMMRTAKAKTECASGDWLHYGGRGILMLARENQRWKFFQSAPPHDPLMPAFHEQERVPDITPGQCFIHLLV